MSRTIKTITVIVFCIWAALISILLYKNYAGTPLEKTQALKEAFDKKTYWYDIYIGTRKTGFAMTTFEKAGNEIIIKHKREIKVKKNGEETLLIENLKTLCDLNYSIKTFEYTSNFKGEKGIKARGEVDEDEIIVFLESPEKRKTHKISTRGEDFYFPMTLIPVIHRESPLPNKPYLVPMLDLNILSVNDVRVVLEEIRPIKVGINIPSLYKFRVGDTIIWTNDNGMIIKEEFPSGMTLYSQFKDTAMDPSDRPLFDFTSLPYFKSNMIFPDTRELTRLSLKVEGFELDPEIYNKSNIVLDKDILTINKINVEELKEKLYKLPYNKADLTEYLNPDKWVLSDYKPLRDTALSYVRTYASDPVSFARYVNGYMDGLIRVQPVFALSDSREILKSLSGDYLERTVMFATYARAGGLPTRLVGGLVYVKGYFYFHTWPEIWLDNWVPVDPTLAQFPADVTHIPLKEGTLTDIISITDDLKNIKFEIMEAS